MMMKSCGLVLLVLAAPAAAQSSFNLKLDPRSGDATVAPESPADRYGSAHGGWEKLGNVNAFNAQIGTANPFAQTIGSQIGSQIGDTIGPH